MIAEQCRLWSDATEYVNTVDSCMSGTILTYMFIYNIHLYLRLSENNLQRKSSLLGLIQSATKSLLSKYYPRTCLNRWGWLGEAKVSSSWCWFTVGEGLLSLQQVRVEGEFFLFLLFLHFHSFSFHPCPSLSSPLLSLFSLSLGDDTKWPTRVDVSLNPNTIIVDNYCLNR